MSVLSKKDHEHTEFEQLIVEKEGQRFSPASRESIEEASRRLGIRLPMSYVHFLSVSNGWIQPNMDAEDGMLLAVDDLELLSRLHPDIYSVWSAPGKTRVSDEDYFNYSESQDPAKYRPEYLEGAIVISEVIDGGVYLLVPTRGAENRELEAWFLGWNLPGAYRYPSFAVMMQNLCFRVLHSPDRGWIFHSRHWQDTCASVL